MKRILVLVALSVVAGCEQQVASDGTTRPASQATAEAMLQAPMPGVSGEIDFARWPTATEKPTRVDPIIASFCRAPS